MKILHATVLGMMAVLALPQSSVAEAPPRVAVWFMTNAPEALEERLLQGDKMKNGDFAIQEVVPGTECRVSEATLRRHAHFGWEAFRRLSCRSAGSSAIFYSDAKCYSKDEKALFMEEAQLSAYRLDMDMPARRMSIWCTFFPLR